MPSIKEGESEDEYCKRCIPYVIEKEGASPDEAYAKCHGMYKQNKEKGTQYTEETKEFTFTFQLVEIPKDCQLDKSELKEFASKETENWVTIRATAIVGDRMMNGFYVPYDELKKSLSQWDGTLHDISHLGTSYPDNAPPFKRENLDYIIGYQNNVSANDETKEVSMDVNIYKKSLKYESWKSFIDISNAAKRTPNVSVSMVAKPKAIKASELNYAESYGFKKDDMVLCLCDIQPRALTTCIKGACDDKKGCGLSNHTVVEDKCECGKESSPVAGGNSEMSLDDAKKLAELKEQIRKLKEEKQ